MHFIRSRLDRAMSGTNPNGDQTYFGSRGFFWSMSNPSFQGHWPRDRGASATQSSASLYPRAYHLCRLSGLALPRNVPATDHFWHGSQVRKHAELLLAFWTSMGFKPSDFMTTGMNEKRTAWLCRVLNRVTAPRSLMRFNLF
jgi:hypothetical protein